MIDAPDLDTALARSLHEQGLVPLVTLRAMLDEARSDRPGVSLARRLIDQGLLPEATLRGVLDALTSTSGPRRAPDPVGEALGPYMLEEALGEGGMGVVHRARHRETGALYAVKSFTPTRTDDLERFERETDAMAAVDGHPNVVRVHGCGAEGGRAYVVMELAEGGDLLTRLQDRGPLPPTEAIPLVDAVAAGVAHLHAQGVLHRDLKPANVLFDAAGVPKLVDFGLARFVDQESLTRTGEVLGTPSHMAPEQALGDKERVGEATDVYGLGALLYHCLTGRPPVSGGSVLAVLNAVVHTKPPRPSELTPTCDAQLDAIVLRALAKRPADRHASVDALRADLAAYLRGELGGGAARTAALLAGILGVLALAVVGVAVVAARPPAPSTPPPSTPPPSTPAGPAARDPVVPAPTPERPSPAATSPPAWLTWTAVHRGREVERAGLKLAYLAQAKTVFAFGGRVATQSSSSELIAWDHAARAWRLAGGARTQSTDRRHRFGMIAHHGRGSLLVAGGYRTPSSLRRSLAEWTPGRGWTSGETWPPLPTVRHGLGLAFDPRTQRVYAFGGRLENGLTNELLFSSGERWTPVPASGPWPSPREDFAMTFDAHRGKLMVFGGVGEDSTGSPRVLADLWEFDGAAWVERSLLPRRPMRRRAATLIDLGAGHTLLIGGTPTVDRAGPALDEVWLRAQDRWHRLDFVTRPRARWSAGAAWDPQREVLVLAGGADAKGLTGDTWELSGLPIVLTLPDVGYRLLMGKVPLVGKTLEENFKYAALGVLVSRYGKSLRYLETALTFKGASEHPLAPLIHLQHGRVLQELKEPQKAVAALSEALRLAPDLHEARRLRGAAYRDLKSYALALADVEAYLARIPAPDAEYDRARALLGLGREPEAVEVLRRLTAAVDPRAPHAKEARELLEELGR